MMIKCNFPLKKITNSFLKLRDTRFSKKIKEIEGHRTTIREGSLDYLEKKLNHLLSFYFNYIIISLLTKKHNYY